MPKLTGLYTAKAEYTTLAWPRVRRSAGGDLEWGAKGLFKTEWAFFADVYKKYADWVNPVCSDGVGEQDATRSFPLG